MKKILITTVAVIAALSFHQKTSAQLLKKLKAKADQVANKVIDKKVDEAVGVDDQNSQGSNGSGPGATTGNRNGKPTNTSGEGLKNTTPPDVNQQIADAEKAHAAGN